MKVRIVRVATLRNRREGGRGSLGMRLRGLVIIAHLQRREDMTSRRSDYLHALITFQGQESWMQATGMALWTKSRWALGVFY